MRKLLAIVPCLLLLGASAAASPFAFANTSSAEFGTIDLGTGAFSLIGLTPDVLSGIATTPSGKVYGVDAVTGDLVLINPGNASTTVVGSTGQSLVVFAGLPSGELYGMDYDANLYSIDGATGAASFVGATGLPAIPADHAFANGLAGDGSSLYYSFQQYATGSHSALAPTLYRIDPLTGVTVPIGATATDATTGLGFIDGLLYGPGETSTDFNLYSFDRLTGAASFIGPISDPDGLLYGLAAPMPEPGTIGLLGAGLLLAGLLRRRSL